MNENRTLARLLYSFRKMPYFLGIQLYRPSDLVAKSYRIIFKTYQTTGTGFRKPKIPLLKHVQAVGLYLYPVRDLNPCYWHEKPAS